MAEGKAIAQFLTFKSTKMKTNYLKISMLLMVAFALATTANAQKSTKKTAYDPDNNYANFSSNGREQIQTHWKGKAYQIELLKDKMTSLAIDGETIPPARWGEYSKEIASIREQIKKDRIQAKKDQEQAMRDQQQAKRDMEQASRDQLQAKRDQEQARIEQEHAKLDQEQATRDQVQAKRDQEQAGRDQEQAKRDQEQAKLDQIQAKKDQEQAKEDQRLLKQMTGDLVADHIIPNDEALHDISFNSEELIVNGVKQPDSVFKKYSEKYKRFAKGNSSYENGKKQFNGLHIHRN